VIVVDFDLYLICVDLGTPFECFGEFGFDVLSRNAMFKRDETRNAANAGEKLHSALGVVDLILPVDFASQCYPAVVDLRLNELVGNADVPVERIQYGLCDVAVVAMMERRNLDLEFIGKRMNARHTSLPFRPPAFRYTRIGLPRTHRLVSDCQVDDTRSLFACDTSRIENDRRLSSSNRRLG